MNSLAQHTNLLKRFPRFELSYETVSHKKVSSSDSVAIAIAFGRKCFLWYTYQEGGSKDACYLIGLDKDKQICSVEQRSCGAFPNRFCLGTVIYCTIYEPPGDDSPSKLNIAEDIYYYCGTNLSNLCFGDRIGFLKEFIQKSETNSVSLPIMWHLEKGAEHTHVIGTIPERGTSVGIGRFSGETTQEFRSENPADIASKMGYTAHHIQYREIHRVSPYINVAIPKRSCYTQSTIAPTVSSAKIAQKLTASTVPITNQGLNEFGSGGGEITNIMPNFDFSKPAYRYPAIFKVTADPQLDLYHLYAYGGPNNTVYCGLAGIQSYKTSVFMNRIFRRIRENDNLDLVEESEDEEDFENIDLNKYVHLDVMVPVECIFNQKHKKWIPVRLAEKRERLIHIEKLVVGNNNARHETVRSNNSNNDNKHKFTSRNKSYANQRFRNG